MPSKYDAVLPNLRPAPPADPSWQDRVERFKATIVERDSASLAAEYVNLRAAKDDLDAEASVLNLRLEAYTQLLVASQDADADGWGRYGVAGNALRLASGDTIRVQREPYGQVRDKEAFRLWCVANGYERQLQLWPSTMNAIVKERLVAGDPEPDGVEAYARAKVVYVQAKKEGA
jgi:hypothetical protein